MTNYNWGIVYLVTDSRLSAKERISVTIAAITMYRNHQKMRKLKTNTYEGYIETAGEHQVLGCFGGQRFSARLDTNDHGKVRLEFLVAEPIDPSLN